ncbi:MAG: tRNA (guanosine(46)-N7)-methyltransferase TrmB [Coleofasciculaceae cyanobacterium SM2_3_26]|nr:tRNA (guanosine(46)-N7)-methyltransferase TrmB [Coleofasciculaceae cyanobacterium SM2_3_26]
MARVRVRQHVNPLSQQFQMPITLPQWQEVYADATRPLHLDLGCARGRFAMQMAQAEPEWNFLGLEIRKPLVDEANAWRDREGLQNLHFLFCHVNHSLPGILRSLPLGVLQRVTILFPDPWFKKRHQKRRMVQSDVVHTLAAHLTEGCEVWIASDVGEVAVDMRDRFAAHPAFQPRSSEWIAENPFPVASEREIATLNKGEPVYRTVFLRCGIF